MISWFRYILVNMHVAHGVVVICCHNIVYRLLPYKAEANQCVLEIRNLTIIMLCNILPLLSDPMHAWVVISLTHEEHSTIVAQCTALMNS